MATKATKFEYVLLQGKQNKGYDGDFYLIVDGDKELGSFRLKDLGKPDYCKHMDLTIYQETTEEIVNRGNFPLLLRIYRFVFNSVLKITHEEKGFNLCKLYSQSDLLGMIYHKFANELNKRDYVIKRSGNLVEISKSEKNNKKTAK